MTFSSTSESEEMASACHVEAINSVHVFKITYYSLSQGMGIGGCLQSGKFTVDGHDWAIVFYLDSHEVNESADDVSVFVTLLSGMATDGAVVRETSTLACSTSGVAHQSSRRSRGSHTASRRAARPRATPNS